MMLCSRVRNGKYVVNDLYVIIHFPFNSFSCVLCQDRLGTEADVREKGIRLLRRAGNQKSGFVVCLPPGRGAPPPRG
eukprot:COSAG06_NODE_4136_length_4535_cov_7.572813_5_plen_77_part_00